jgi:hypothetical protein
VAGIKKRLQDTWPSVRQEGKSTDVSKEPGISKMLPQVGKVVLHCRGNKRKTFC